MVVENKNIIRRQTVNFHYNGNTDGFALQKDVSEWCKLTLIPEIEQQLEFFNFSDNYITIDKLEIDAAVDKKDWQQRIRNELISNLNQQLRNYKPADSKGEADQKNENRSNRLDELILFYFEKGYLPWWSKSFIENTFETVLLNWLEEEKTQDRADYIILKLQQISSGPVINRIINLVPNRLFFKLVKQIFKKEIETITEAESFFSEVLKISNATLKEKKMPVVFYEVVLAMLIKNDGKINTDLSLQIFREVTKYQIENNTSVLKILQNKPNLAGNRFAKCWQNILAEEIKNNTDESNMEGRKESRMQYQQTIDQLTGKIFEEKNKENMTEDLKEGIYIENGGAVIITAFLPMLFERLRITVKNKIVKPDLAALLIQYIVSGKTKAEEHELLLPKLLCGISPELPVNTNKKISAIQKKEADEMLLSVIKHWAVIKNTSIEGLRESFLKRNGKLILMDDEWLLQVEQKSYDLLLNQLPWSISMIKLPWMKNLLKTEWV